MPKSGSSRADTVAFVAKLLKSDPELSFADMKKKGKAAGQHVYPLIVGLARKELGWAPSAKARAAKAADGAPRRGPGRPRKDGSAPRRGPGRPPKARAMATGDAAGALAAIEREFASMREALRAIADVASKF
jgi:hypothetical protein